MSKPAPGRCRFARKTAEDLGAAEEILKMCVGPAHPSHPCDSLHPLAKALSGLQVFVRAARLCSGARRHTPAVCAASLAEGTCRFPGRRFTFAAARVCAYGEFDLPPAALRLPKPKKKGKEFEWLLEVDGVRALSGEHLAPHMIRCKILRNSL